MTPRAKSWVPTGHLTPSQAPPGPSRLRWLGPGSPLRRRGAHVHPYWVLVLRVWSGPTRKGCVWHESQGVKPKGHGVGTFQRVGRVGPSDRNQGSGVSSGQRPWRDELAGVLSHSPDDAKGFTCWGTKNRSDMTIGTETTKGPCQRGTCGGRGRPGGRVRGATQT